MKKIIIATGIILIAGALVAVYFFGYRRGLIAVRQARSLFQPTPTITPIPFYNLTIPYLRSKTYNSQLGELKEIDPGSNYARYLTSYESDNLKINALLTKPDGNPPAGGWPAIVFVHGYIPPNQYQTLERYVDYVDYLARNGYVVFKIDLRGHGDSEGQSSGGYYSSGYVIDTLNAYSALQNASFVNPKEIGLWGHSMAGNIVLRTLAVKPDIPAAVIWSGAGYTYQDLLDYRIHDSSYVPQPSMAAQRLREQLMKAVGPVTSTSAFWKIMAPTNYLSDMKGAIELDQAIDDETVSIDYTRNLKRLLDNTAIPHEVYEYPSGGHNISGVSFGLAMDNTVKFYNKYLKKESL